MDEPEYQCDGDGAILGTDCKNWVDVRKYHPQELDDPDTPIFCNDHLEQEAFEHRQESIRKDD